MTHQIASEEARRICLLAPVIPVLVVEDVSTASRLAQSLISGGLPVLEITLRTPTALEVIAEMTSVCGGVIGAGTLLCSKDVENAVKAGAKFGVSPGATDSLLDACEEAKLPLLPGAATPSEIMRLYDRGYNVQKFFPAEVSGGISALKAISAPIPQVKFCPTGGISSKNAKDYLSLENTICVGGSWMAPRELMKAKDWSTIELLASEAANLCTQTENPVKSLTNISYY